MLLLGGGGGGVLRIVDLFAKGLAAALSAGLASCPGVRPLGIRLKLSLVVAVRAPILDACRSFDVGLLPESLMLVTSSSRPIWLAVWLRFTRRS